MLSQASDGHDPITQSKLWMSSEKLEISGVHALEWENYIKELKMAGITLDNNKDTLLWTIGDSFGNISVKNIYDAIISTQ